MQKSQQSWVRSQHPPTRLNLRAADEAVLNSVHKLEKLFLYKFEYEKMLPLFDKRNKKNFYMNEFCTRFLQNFRLFLTVHAG